MRFPRLELENATLTPYTEEFEALSTGPTDDEPLVDATPTITMPPELDPDAPELPEAPEPEPMLESTPEAAAQPVVEVAPEPEEEEPGAADNSGPDETAQWWLAAWARWSGWKSSLNFADAVREEIGKYPYMLSVPIQKSPEYEDGLLAYGYSILMDHVERQNPGCVGNALNSLKPGGAQPVGDQLYAYLVTEGRLRETYADFVRATILGAVPEPGLWFQFRILESKDDTRILQRPSARLGRLRALRPAPGQRRPALRRAQVQDDARTAHHALRPGIGRRQGIARDRREDPRRRKADRQRLGRGGAGGTGEHEDRGAAGDRGRYRTWRGSARTTGRPGWRCSIPNRRPTAVSS